MSNETADPRDERYKDHFMILVCLAALIAHGLWYDQFHVDFYSLVIAGIGLFLVYKPSALSFFIAHLRSVSLNANGISIEVNNQLENLARETDNIQGEGQMVDPMAAHLTHSPMPPPLRDPHKFVAPPAQHKLIIAGLAQSVSALKKALVGEKECLFVEAIFSAFQSGAIDENTKDLLLKLNGTLTIIQQFPQFITSGQILMAQYICDKLRAKVKTIS